MFSRDVAEVLVEVLVGVLVEVLVEVLVKVLVEVLAEVLAKVLAKVLVEVLFENRVIRQEQGGLPSQEPKVCHPIGLAIPISPHPDIHCVTHSHPLFTSPFHIPPQVSYEPQSHHLSQSAANAQADAFQPCLSSSVMSNVPSIAS